MTALFCVLAVASPYSGKAVKLKVVGQGVPTGTASFVQKLLPDGSKQSQLSIEIGATNSRRVRVKLDRTYAPNGSPVRAFSEVWSEQPRYRKTTTATFNRQGAHVVVDENGKRTVREVSLVENAPRECVSEFWFVRDKPKKGEKAKYYHFDLDKLEWRLVESEYLGAAKIMLHGRSVNCHRVRTASGQAFLDDEGDPLRIEDASVTMEREAAGSN